MCPRPCGVYGEIPGPCHLGGHHSWQRRDEELRVTLLVLDRGSEEPGVGILLELLRIIDAAFSRIKQLMLLWLSSLQTALLAHDRVLGMF